MTKLQLKTEERLRLIDDARKIYYAHGVVSFPRKEAIEADYIRALEASGLENSAELWALYIAGWSHSIHDNTIAMKEMINQEQLKAALRNLTRTYTSSPRPNGLHNLWGLLP